MKTTIEILEVFHEQAEGKLIEKKINLRAAERRALVIKPGKDYAEIETSIVNFKLSVKNLTTMLEVIDDMIKEEKKGNKK